MADKPPVKETVFSTSIRSMAEMQNPEQKRTLNFEVSPQDADLIARIAQRAVDRFGPANTKPILINGAPMDLKINDNGIQFRMDLSAIHNMKPLRLYSLLLCSDADFNREFVGITICWHRHEGVFMHGFRSQFHAADSH